MLTLRNEDLIISDIENDHEVEIIIQKNKPQSVWINTGMAQEIIEHLQEQFKLEPRQ